jgi:ADP-ribose pyrophosphatase YjhB (NUDIX family)
MNSTPRWLEYARRIHTIAQAGLSYTQNPFDIERYHHLLELSAEIIAHAAELDTPAVHTLLQAESGPGQYATPKIDVRGAAFREGKILLVREMLDEGRWTLPGGWMDMGDTPGGAAAREFREETGYEVRVRKLAAVYDRDRHGHPPYLFSIIKMFFIVEITGGHPLDSIETGESAFFSVNQLPELSIRRVTAAEIEMLFRHASDATLPTEFDDLD